MSREALFWRRVLVWATVIILLALAAYLVIDEGHACARHGGQLDGATCATPSGVEIPRP